MDATTIRIALVGLILTVLAVILGAVYLIAQGQELPDALIAIGAGAAGAIGGAIAVKGTPSGG